jgi:hypothetical protein
MKLLNKKIAALFLAVFTMLGIHAFCQDAKKGDLSIAVGYFLSNNKLPYVQVKVKTKVDGRFKPVGDVKLKLYLNKEDAGTLIGEVVTNSKGEAASVIPPALKSVWGATPGHTFVASFAGNKLYAATTGDLTVAKAKIVIDTTADRKVTATVFEMKDSGWVPVKGVELKIAVKRLGADLPVNETPTFTTDSTGQASADFKRDSIPGDAAGIITLVAKIEDNDQYGNISAEKAVPWGAKFIAFNNFDRRTLFATRDKAPIWLGLMATSIIIVVWGILISLVVNIVKIKKLGEQASS